MAIIERARELRKMIERMASGLDNQEALENVELFPRWQEGISYTVDERVNHDDKLYRCVQAHTSQDAWTPDLTPALWALVSLEEWPEWIQPTGAQDAYMTGDKVSHNEKHWISTADNNVWEPGVYGWDEA